LDIRSVRASRVNMRQGPNTTYPILGRLLAGDEVEILRDQETGWAMVKVEKTGQIGWIATSLLSLKGS
jgi:SH3-like domain-containing protein